jgi:hypothetical protein
MGKMGEGQDGWQGRAGCMDGWIDCYYYIVERRKVELYWCMVEEMERLGSCVSTSLKMWTLCLDIMRGWWFDTRVRLRAIMQSMVGLNA